MTSIPDAESAAYFAELQLSAYRNALHRRLELATGELIARYHEDPSLCLCALPLADPGRRAQLNPARAIRMPSACQTDPAPV